MGRPALFSQPYNQQKMMSEEQIKKSGILSPGLVDGQITTFLAASNNQFYSKRQGESNWLKDAKGNFILIPYASVIHARQNYLAHYGEQEKEAKIQAEYKKLGEALTAKAVQLIDHIKEQHKWANDDDNFLQNVIRTQNPTLAADKKQQAILFFENNPHALRFTDHLQRLIDEQDYEDLATYIDEPAEPLAIFQQGSQALSNLFSASMVESTITELKEKGSLYMKAKINVEKRYYP